MLFVTGFPGFLGTRLVQTLTQADTSLDVHLLIQPKFAEQAQDTIDALGIATRATLHEGDITKPDLGLGTAYDTVAKQITRAVHFAAVYDLTIPRDVGWRVNVTGTKHVLDLMEAAPNLQTFGYVSTAYVSGTRDGRIYETDLVHNAGFKNFYEETKYHAEVLVQERREHIPTMIFRPGIVVGDSQTGATDKFDGPYYILRALQRLPRYTLMARVGTGAHPVHLTPVDYVIDTMAHLMQSPQYNDTVFHLTDPDPLSTQQIMDLFVEHLGMHVAYVPVPSRLARRVAGSDAGRYLGIAPQLIDYFDHDVHYDTTNTEAALEGTGIHCPPLSSYVDRLTAYMKQATKARSEAMY